MAFIILTFYFLVGQVFGQKQCNLRQAEQCAVNLQSQFDEAYMEYERQDMHIITRKFTDLCRSIIVGSNITVCYDDNIKMCDETAAKYVKTQWTETMEDIQVFCNDSVCTHFQDLQKCKSKLYENGIQDGQVEKFCRTFNESVDCANEIFNDTCLFNITFYYSLLARPSKSYYNRACLSGCKTLDDTIQALNTCWKHHYTNASNCQRQSNKNAILKRRIHEEINKLLPRAIQYAEREVECTTTTSTTTTQIPQTTTQIPLTTSQIPITTTQIPLTTMITTSDLPDTTIAKTTIKENLKLTSSDFPSNENKNCLVHVKDQSSLKALHINFETCMSVFKVYSCLNTNISIGKDMLILNELLPQNIFNFTEDVFEKCHQVINNYHSYIQRVESSCGRPKAKNIGCTGHNYGLLDCSSSMYLL
ncbi:unnamed protein product [Mytilus coruscus]|uniref:DUF19 domain-containing protein n=1 Tax=Mytilus coruscus TaxID=42192 RepID=A0A6J8ELW5_MYTCO|nr:unnamed protein product [Mytilus coruscus]